MAFTRDGRAMAIARKPICESASTRACLWYLGAFLALGPLKGGAATYIVENADDVCEGCAAAPGSLRKAVELANASVGVKDTILFRIPGPGPHVIQPRSPFTISDPVLIDGFSQADSSANTQATTDDAVRQIVLSAERMEHAGPAIVIGGAGTNSAVRGLIIDGDYSRLFGTTFSEGILIEAGGYNEISGNLITRTCGGVFVLSSSYNMIGGPAVSNRNVVVANRCTEFTYDGIHIEGPNASYNLVEGNFVGLREDGITADSNKPNGVAILSAANNTVGGDTAAQRNIISGNAFDGIRIETGAFRATGNHVLGNFVGLDARGLAAVPNEEHGVLLNASDNTVGGESDPRFPFSPRNVISGNRQVGVLIRQGGNLVQGNYVGTDAAGLAALGNSQSGIEITGNGNLIGGTAVGAGNVISGNGENGIMLDNAPALSQGPEGNDVEGNLIGTDATGTRPLANARSGVTIRDGAFNTVGSLVDLGSNLISGNGEEGIRIEGAGAKINNILANIIGADITGTIALSNKFAGVLITNASDNSIGPANLISGNGGQGIEIAAANGTLVYQNAIGTDITLGASLGNALNGVHLAADAIQNSIGGINGVGNFIAGNHGNGIRIEGSQNRVEGNWIGTDLAGTGLLGNCFNGVFLGPAASDNVIGGRANRAGNVIAFNGGTCPAPIGDPIPEGNGVLVTSLSINNGLFGNSIFSNSGLGIELSPPAGVTPNDLGGDGDEGPNHLQNFPAVSDAATGGGVTTLQVSLDSTPATGFTIDFYANRECDPSGYGQGQLYLGSITTSTDGGGNAALGVILPVNVPEGFVLTATATDPNNNTSEFSKCAPITFVNHAPVAVCHDVRIQAVGSCEAAVDAKVLGAGSYDPDGESITVTLSPPPPYPVGTTVVTVTVTDPHGVTDHCTATVTVLDGGPPAITCPPWVTQTAEPGKCSAVVTFAPPTATDNCPGPIGLSCSPPSGSTFAVGTTAVTCVATDGAGNSSSCKFLVVVKSSAECPGLKIISSGTDTASGAMALTIQVPFPGQQILVQETADLSQQSWVDVPNAAITPQNQNGVFLIQFPGQGTTRFYRVLAWPNQQ